MAICSAIAMDRTGMQLRGAWLRTWRLAIAAVARCCSRLCAAGGVRTAGLATTAPPCREGLQRASSSTSLLATAVGEEEACPPRRCSVEACADPTARAFERQHAWCRGCRCIWSCNCSCSCSCRCSCSCHWLFALRSHLHLVGGLFQTCGVLCRPHLSGGQAWKSLEPRAARCDWSFEQVDQAVDRCALQCVGAAATTVLQASACHLQLWARAPLPWLVLCSCAEGHALPEYACAQVAERIQQQLPEGFEEKLKKDTPIAAPRPRPPMCQGEQAHVGSIVPVACARHNVVGRVASRSAKPCVCACLDNRATAGMC